MVKEQEQVENAKVNRIRGLTKRQKDMLRSKNRVLVQEKLAL